MAAIAGSPIQPRPRLASVMPNCVTERYRSRRPTMDSATIAFLSPLRARERSCVARTLTRANSAATKKPLRATHSAATTRPHTGRKHYHEPPRRTGLNPHDRTRQPRLPALARGDARLGAPARRAGEVARNAHGRGRDRRRHRPRTDGARPDLRRTVRRGSSPGARRRSMIGGYTTIAVVLLLVVVGVEMDLGVLRRRGSHRRAHRAARHRAALRQRRRPRPSPSGLGPARSGSAHADGAPPGRRAEHLRSAGHRQDAARPGSLQVGRRSSRHGVRDDRRRRRMARPVPPARTRPRRGRRRGVVREDGDPRRTLRRRIARRGAADHRRGDAPRGALGGVGVGPRAVARHPPRPLRRRRDAGDRPARDLRRIRRRPHRRRVLAHQRANARGDRRLRRQRLRSGLLRVDRAPRRLRGRLRSAPRDPRAGPRDDSQARRMQRRRARRRAQVASGARRRLRHERPRRDGHRPGRPGARGRVAQGPDVRRAGAHVARHVAAQRAGDEAPALRARSPTRTW